MRIALLLLVTLPACAALPLAPAPVAPPAVAAPATAPNPACATPEHRQLDFWVGDWDVAIRARQSPDKDQWAESRGHNHVESLLGGCVVGENFTAEGPGAPWAGKSFSMYVPAQKGWRQTWVDDSGSYLAFVGERKDGTMTLVGELGKTKEGKPMQMRMVFFDISPDHLMWRWERTTDGGDTWTPMMQIAYARHGSRAAGL